MPCSWGPTSRASAASSVGSVSSLPYSSHCWSTCSISASSFARFASVAARPPSATLDPGASAVTSARQSGQGWPCPLDRQVVRAITRERWQSAPRSHAGAAVANNAAAGRGVESPVPGRRSSVEGPQRAGTVSNANHDVLETNFMCVAQPALYPRLHREQLGPSHDLAVLREIQPGLSVPLGFKASADAADEYLHVELSPTSPMLSFSAWRSICTRPLHRSSKSQVETT